MTIKTSAMTLAAVTSLFLGGAAQAGTVFSQNFDSGFGTITHSGTAQLRTGADYVSRCGATGSPTSLANQFAAFRPSQGASGGMSIVFDVVAGQLYMLSFDYAFLGTGAGQFLLGPAVDSGAIVLIAARAINGTANNDFDSNFQHYTLDFTAFATFGSVRLQISQRFTGTADAAIDNILITTIDAVPEPASWGMMLVGFGVIGGALRRRASKVRYA